MIVVALAVAGLAAGYVWLLRYTDEQRERVLDSILASHEAPNDSGLVSPATTASPVSASPSQSPVPAGPDLEKIGKMLWEDRTTPLFLLNVPCVAKQDTTGEMAQYLAEFHTKYDETCKAVREWVLREDLTCLDIPPRAPDGSRRRLSKVQAGVDCLRRD
ncbi:MAG: hypothetical protein HYZ00_05845 [Candidatus Hydrogenedentes bacterium]|nr:hypothetical protein [Candidatus Hydrogenedentota bacterium]